MRRLLLFMPEDWYFWVHRLSLARAARAAGYEVALVTRVGSFGAAIEGEGIRLYPLRSFLRSSANPFAELSMLRELVSAYRDFVPTIAHHEALKPVLYGPLAAHLSGVPAVVNVLVGLGFLFASDSMKARVLRVLLLPLLRMAWNSGNSRVIVQNDGDYRTLIDFRLADAGRISKIRGTGVDTSLFAPTPEPSGTPIVMLASRILWDKGVGEFVEASRILRASGCRVRFVLVGIPDLHNPMAIPRKRIEAWVAEGLIEWWGVRWDMPKVLEQASIVCLPSYHEGLPKILLEAAACARPIVATDIPGCHAIARHGINALRVPVRDAAAVAAAVSTLVQDAAMRKRFGEAGRKIVLEELSDEIVCRQTLDAYGTLIASAGLAANGRHQAA